MAALPQRSWFRWVRLDAHVVEGELGLGAAPQPHLLVDAGDADPRRAEVDDDGADALGPVAAGKARPHETGRRLVPAGDVVLVGVEAVAAVAVVGEVGAHEVGGRARVGFGDADAEQALARRGQRKPAFLEAFVAEVLDRSRRSVEDQLGEDGARDVGPPQLLEHDGGLHVAHAHPAVVLADGDAEEAGGLQGVPRVLGELLCLVPVASARRQLPLRQIPRVLAQSGLVFGLDKWFHSPGWY